MRNTGIRSAGGRDEGGGDILFLETFECVIMIGDVSNVLGYYTTHQRSRMKVVGIFSSTGLLIRARELMKK